MPFGLDHLALIPMGLGCQRGDRRGRNGFVLARGREPGRGLAGPAGLGLVAAGGLWLCIWRRPWRLVGLVAVAAGMFSLAIVRPPDVLVSGDAKLLGVRSSRGRALGLVGAQGALHRRDLGAPRRGRGTPGLVDARGPEAADLPQAEGQLRCDGLGCLFRARGHLVALVNDSRALAEDCAAATVVIALEPVDRRRAARSQDW